MPTQGKRGPKTIGVDLGTTNTVAASNGSVLPSVEAHDSSPILPSAVAFAPTNERLIGAPARERIVIDPRNTIVSAKRVIGERWGSSRASRFGEGYPLELVETHDGYVGFDVRAGTFDPRDVAAMILNEACMRSDVSPSEMHAVVTVPTGFDRDNRLATRAAAERLGFLSVQLIDEGIASAMAHLDRSNLRYGAVYDLGGGTFELAVLDCSVYPFHIVAYGSDPYLGGDDVDRAIARWVVEKTLRQAGWDLGSDPEVFARLVHECELAKIRLASDDTTVIGLDGVDPAVPGRSMVVELDRATLGQLAFEVVKRTFSLCDEVLGRARLHTEDIQAVFLAGGSTALHVVRDGVAKYFGRAPRHDVPPMHVVAIGASIIAARPALAEVAWYESAPAPRRKR